jgi:hypothetical protein
VKFAVWFTPTRVKVCGAENVHPASVAVTVYVCPDATENEYVPVALVAAVAVAPPLRAIDAPATSPLGPVTVPEIVSVVIAEVVSTTEGSDCAAPLHPMPTNINATGTNTAIRATCLRSPLIGLITMSPPN